MKFPQPLFDVDPDAAGGSGGTGGTPAPGTPPPAAAPDPGTGGQPDYKALYEAQLRESNEWKGRFTGLQGKYQQEQTKWTSDAAALQEAIGQKTAVLQEKTTVEGLLGTTKEQLDAANSELEIHKNMVARYNIIVSDFPDLLPFLDILPDGSGDELKGRLTTFRERMSLYGTGKVAEFKKGAAPPAPQAAETSEEGLLKQLTAASKSGDLNLYNQIYDQLTALRLARK